MTDAPFWQLTHAPRDAVALTEDGGATLTYGELAERVAQVRAHLPARALMFCFCENSAGSLTGYLAALNARAVPVMLDGQLDETLANALFARWRPEFLWLPEGRARMAGRGAAAPGRVSAYRDERAGTGDGRRAGAADNDLRFDRQPETGAPEL